MADRSVFDGYSLTLYRPDGSIVGSWPAISGRPGNQRPSDQNLPSSGPLTEGRYSFSTGDIQPLTTLDAIEGLVPPKKGRRLREFSYLIAVGVLLLCLSHIQSARADSDSCLAKVASYVAELDELLSREKNHLIPYEDLNGRYFPFRDCEVDALLEEVLRSRFSRPITYNPRANEYYIVFSTSDVKVGFVYAVSKRKSYEDYATFIRW